ncbi:hypothetical protein NQ317_009444 [Molorchus minor]|uniref:Phorbol ester/diacylglycerol-binding protein unc-13 n=1 Tax=Molorchus minor TaxID=1323400 RepID=A0ABQ9JXK9_9CUCU|nr:hypothetical protein NQ317_009444 [Molorchus minor]
MPSYIDQVKKARYVGAQVTLSLYYCSSISVQYLRNVKAAKRQVNHSNCKGSDTVLGTRFSIVLELSYCFQKHDPTLAVDSPCPPVSSDTFIETNDLNTGLLIEVWSKGMIWDRAMGYHWIPLQTVQYSNEEGNGHWLSLDAELVMRDGEVVGTKMPTGHSLLVDCRFELPFDPENIEASDLQRKLEMLNNIMDQEARAEQARRQLQYFGHSYDNQFDNDISAGYSEDSDYTSDLNYPVGQHPNSSASQFRSAAHQIHTPQRSLETSRENSYERDDAPNAQHHHLPQPSQANQHHLSPGSHRRHHQRYSPNTEEYSGYPGSGGQNSSQYLDNSLDSEPLFYNSRPRDKPDYSSRRRKYAHMESEESQEAWVSCESSFYNQSVESIDVGYSADSTDYYGHMARTSRCGGGGGNVKCFFPEDLRVNEECPPYKLTTINQSQMTRGNQREEAREKTTKKKAKKSSAGEDKLPLDKKKARDTDVMQKKQKDSELKKTDATRRPSLERQTTLYDDSTYFGDSSYYQNTEATKVNYLTSTHSFNQNQSCDEYYDSLSYPFQEERYGQDEEDRQWDSGGYYPINTHKTGKRLPSIPATTNHNKRRPSGTVDEGYPSYEDQFRPTATPTGRRRMPKIPTKRSTSRQSSLNEEVYEGYRTPENSSHRGASLPPTPTKTIQLPNRLGTQSKPFNSLPPTPGRQLPKPNLNRSNLRAKRNNQMKRTSSADYADNLYAYDNYYMRPGAMSARETYNEDYNYAYQSIDNLGEDGDEIEANSSDNRVNVNANYLELKKRSVSRQLLLWCSR